MILQAARTRSSSDCRRALTSKGTLVPISGESPAAWSDLRFLKELIEADKLTPVIDRSYSLSEVPQAIAYLEEGHARGKVVIGVES